MSHITKCGDASKSPAGRACRVQHFLDPDPDPGLFAGDAASPNCGIYDTAGFLLCWISYYILGIQWNCTDYFNG